MKNKRFSYIIFLLFSCFRFDGSSAEELKSINKFVIEAARAGVLDEESAKILMAYSILTDMTMEDVQTFLMAVELSGVLNQTRAIDFVDHLDYLKDRSSGNGWAWFFGGTSCVLFVCVLILLFYDSSSRANKLNHAKRKAKKAFAWTCSTGENWYLQAQRAVKNAIASKQRQ